MLRRVSIGNGRDHKRDNVLNRPAFNSYPAKAANQARVIVRRLVLAGLGLLVGLGAILPVQANMIRDTEIEAGIDELIAPLIRVAGFAPGAIDVRIILDNRLNAFVQSKRTVYINSGLIESSDDPLLFLGVMAHELAHIKAGHVQQIDETLTTAGTAAALATIAAVAIAACCSHV